MKKKSKRLFEKCQHCGGPIPGFKQATEKYCSAQCAIAGNMKEKPASRQLKEWPFSLSGFVIGAIEIEDNTLPISSKPDLNTGQSGAVNELCACAYFLSRGFYVFRSMSQTAPFDLVIYRNGILARVEVTSASIGKQGQLSWPKHDPRNYDIVAAVGRDKDIYLLDNQGQLLYKDTLPLLFDNGNTLRILRP